MIQIKSKLDCCGCTACASSCPKSAITMVPDEEGFLYPKIDMRRCIECGACERACPILNKKTVISEKTEGYIIRIKDNKILYESTSGGAFTALADYILKQNGIVYGAGYDNNMRVVCKRATTKQQLQEMRGSKFVQSDLGNIFQDIKKELKEGTTILFSGTPCQVAGLLSFLRKKPDNLLCVDFVCRGVPSPGLWDNYVKYMENKYSSKIVGARFKHKTYGYHTSTMKIDFANGKTYYGSGRVDPYMKAFVREISSRPSCAACAFKGIERPTLISQFLTLLYLVFTSKAWEYFSVKSIRPTVFKRVGAYSIPLIPNNLAWWVVNASDRTIIAHFLGTAANGIYSIANKFPNVFINFYNILNLSWTETVSLHFDDEDRDEFLTETMTSLFKLFAAACFGIVACMPFVFPILINEKYVAGYDQILILMYAMLFRVLVGLYSCIYVAQKNAKKIAYTSISAAIINITVNLILINKIKIFAASISTLVAFFSMFIIRYIDVNKTVHMRIRKPIIIGSILIGTMLIGTYYCENKMIQLIALCITAIYAVLTNVDMLKSGMKLVKNRFGK